MNQLLNYELIHIDQFHLKVSTLVFIALSTLAMWLVLFLFQKGLNRVKRLETPQKYAIHSLVKYVAIVAYLIIILQILGFDISVLLAGSAALLVGLGLGLQNIFSDFFSGIILLVDSSIKVDDILEVNGMVCKVQKIKLRTTTVLTRDDHFIILPNTYLTRNNVINWTHSDITSRFDISVGIDYGSDPRKAIAVMEQVMSETDKVKKHPKAFVRFNKYAESSLIFTLYFWSDEVFRVENIKSDMRIRLFYALKENHINIPFPQRVVHVKGSDNL